MNKTNIGISLTSALYILVSAMFVGSGGWITLLGIGMLCLPIFLVLLKWIEIKISNESKDVISNIAKSLHNIPKDQHEDLLSDVDESIRKEVLNEYNKSKKP